MFQNWLKPGGKVLISDYCCTDKTWSDVYTAYVKQRGYILLTVHDYGKVSLRPTTVSILKKGILECLINIFSVVLGPILVNHKIR